MEFKKSRLMKENSRTPIIEYFCQELPDRWNLLKWTRDLRYDDAVFQHPEGLMYEMRVYRHQDGGFGMVHVMVIGLN